MGSRKCPVAIDCEMVGVEDGRSILAKVSVVDDQYKCIYDKLVAPTEDVSDYRTWIHGLKRKDIHSGENFYKVRREVKVLIRDRILVGHAIHYDLKVLDLQHPPEFTFDTQKWYQQRGYHKTKLEILAPEVLGIKIRNDGYHDSIEDAVATMKLYKYATVATRASAEVQNMMKLCDKESLSQHTPAEEMTKSDATSICDTLLGMLYSVIKVIGKIIFSMGVIITALAVVAVITAFFNRTQR